MKSRKIALVSDAVLPFNKGGKETRIDHLAKELVAIGYDVHIYTMKWWDGDKTTVIGDITYHAISPLYPLYTGERRSMKEGILFGVMCLKLLFEDFDILDVDHMPFFPLFSAKVVALVRRKPFYANWHEVWGREYWNEYLGGTAGRIASLIEIMSVRMPDHIISGSSFTDERLRSILHYKGPLTLVSNGIDYKRIQRTIPYADHHDVLYAGRLLAHKNVDVLVKAIAILKKTHPSISLTIIGEGPEEPRIKSLVEKLDLKDNIEMKGFLESVEMIYAHMKSSSVFVLPSSREGFGIALLEASASGASILTVDEPSNASQYVARDLGGMVVSLTPAAIANAISELLVTKYTASDAVHETYDWSYLAMKMSEVYER